MSKQAQRSISEFTASAQSAISQAMEDTSQWLREQQLSISQTGEELRRKLEDRLSEAASTTKDQFELNRERISSIVEDYPLIAVISAMAAGFVLGLSLSRGLRRRGPG